MKIFNFYGRDIVIRHDPVMGSFASLGDLCEIHQCGTPDDVIPLLREDCGGCYEPDRLMDDWGLKSSEALVNLDDNDLMGTIRGLSADWSLAVRFREWLVARVFQASPHREYDDRRWGEAIEMFAECGVPQGQSLAERRDNFWAKELERHHAFRESWNRAMFWPKRGEDAG